MDDKGLNGNKTDIQTDNVYATWVERFYDVTITQKNSIIKELNEKKKEKRADIKSGLADSRKEIDKKYRDHLATCGDFLPLFELLPKCGRQDPNYLRDELYNSINKDEKPIKDKYIAAISTTQIGSDQELENYRKEVELENRIAKRKKERQIIENEKKKIANDCVEELKSEYTSKTATWNPSIMGLFYVIFLSLALTFGAGAFGPLQANNKTLCHVFVIIALVSAVCDFALFVIAKLKVRNATSPQSNEEKIDTLIKQSADCDKFFDGLKESFPEIWEKRVKPSMYRFEKDKEENIKLAKELANVRTQNVAAVITYYLPWSKTKKSIKTAQAEINKKEKKETDGLEKSLRLQQANRIAKIYRDFKNELNDGKLSSLFDFCLENQENDESFIENFYKRCKSINASSANDLLMCFNLVSKFPLVETSNSFIKDPTWLRQQKEKEEERKYQEYVREIERALQEGARRQQEEHDREMLRQQEEHDWEMMRRQQERDREMMRQQQERDREMLRQQERQRQAAEEERRRQEEKKERDLREEYKKQCWTCKNYHGCPNAERCTGVCPNYRRD